MGKENDGHRKKMIAPVVITVLFTAYLAAYSVFLLRSGAGSPLFALLAVPLLGLGVGMVYTLATRIKEIRSGEEDDLDNY